MRGRKKVPASIHKLTGTYQKSRHAGEVVIDPVLPDPPDHLGDIAKDEWLRIAPKLHELKILSTLDLPVLEAYCTSYGIWRDAKEDLVELIIETPNGYQQQSAMLLVCNNAVKQMQSLAADLGLTPAARARLRIAEQPKKMTLDDMIGQVKKAKNG